MIAFLIRHGTFDAVGRWLPGRRAGVALNDDGRREVTQLVRALRWTPISAVYSSPLDRALQTAQPLAVDHSLDMRVRPALTEIDFGHWTGRTLDELSNEPDWAAFNTDRTHACPPGGEALHAVQQRIVDELVTLSKSHQGETIAVVTHAEPIRCALAAFDGTTLDDALTVEISPAHVSVIGITSGVRRVLSVNLPASTTVV